MGKSIYIATPPYGANLTPNQADQLADHLKTMAAECRLSLSVALKAGAHVRVKGYKGVSVACSVAGTCKAKWTFVNIATGRHLGAWGLPAYCDLFGLVGPHPLTLVKQGEGYPIPGLRAHLPEEP